MLEIPNILWPSLTSLLKNLPARNFCSSWSLQHSTDSSDDLPINYWPPVWKPIPEHNPELHRMIHIYLMTERVPHVKGEPYMVEQLRVQNMVSKENPQFRME